MSARRDYFYDQLLTEAELDAGFEGLEQADRDIMGDLALIGVVLGLAVSQHNPTADLTVDVASGTAYDQEGQRMRVSSLQIADMSEDYNGQDTAVQNSGKSKVLSLYLEFERAPSDPRIDGNSNPVYFVRAETYAFYVVQGAEATTGTETPPTLETDKILLADVTIDYGQTQILDADINTNAVGGNRRMDAFVASAGALSLREGTPEEAVDALLTEINNHITDAGAAHAATAISAAVAATWENGDPISGTTVDAVEEEIVSALAAKVSGPDCGANRVGCFAPSTTFHDGVAPATGSVIDVLNSLIALLAEITGTADCGSDRIGSAAYSGTGTSLSAGSIMDQLKELADELGGLATANTWTLAQTFNTNLEQLTTLSAWGLTAQQRAGDGSNKGTSTVLEAAQGQDNTSGTAGAGGDLDLRIGKQGDGTTDGAIGQYKRSYGDTAEYKWIVHEWCSGLVTYDSGGVDVCKVAMGDDDRHIVEAWFVGEDTAGNEVYEKEAAGVSKESGTVTATGTADVWSKGAGDGGISITKQGANEGWQVGVASGAGSGHKGVVWVQWRSANFT